MAKYQIEVQDIVYEIARVLKSIYPESGDLRVHQERIADLKTPAMSIELVQYSTPQFSQNLINKRVDLDIIYFSESDTVAEALSMVNPLMSAFSMGLKVYERDFDGNIQRDENGNIVYSRFIHCLRPPEYTLVDQDLHFMVTFEFADNYKPIYVHLDDENVSEYNTADETLDNKEIEFINDEDNAKNRAYINEPYRLMEDLYTNVNCINASMEIKKG